MFPWRIGLRAVLFSVYWAEPDEGLSSYVDAFPKTGIQWISLSPIPENGTPGLWAYRISETAVSGIIITWYFLDGLRHVGTTNQLGSAKAGRYATYSLTGSYTGGWQFGAEGSQRGSQRKLQPRSRVATIDNDWLWLHHSNSGSWKSNGFFFSGNIYEHTVHKLLLRSQAPFQRHPAWAKTGIPACNAGNFIWFRRKIEPFQAWQGVGLLGSVQIVVQRNKKRNLQQVLPKTSFLNSHPS